MLTSLTNVEKIVRNIFKKCWWKKYWQQFRKLLIKKVKACRFWELESVKSVVLGFMGFIIRLIIHLPVGREPPAFDGFGPKKSKYHRKHIKHINNNYCSYQNNYFATSFKFSYL
jgi:hypothetical protein